MSVKAYKSNEELTYIFNALDTLGYVYSKYQLTKELEEYCEDDYFHNLADFVLEKDEDYEPTGQWLPYEGVVDLLEENGVLKIKRL